jgi:hypothetical protein
MVNTPASKVATWRTVYFAAVLTKHALNFIACSWRLIRDRLPILYHECAVLSKTVPCAL